jgi:hypothetical protein
VTSRPAHRIALRALAVLGALAPLAAQGPPPPIMPPPSMVGPQKAEPPHPQPAAPAAPAAPSGPVRLTPRAWRYSTYSFEGRVETGVTDVTVKVPPAYEQSFAFWTNRMKGSSRTELIQYLTTTREPDKDGLTPFRRQVARYSIDMNDHGEVKAASSEFIKGVMSLAWEGAFDPHGKATGVKRVAGPEDMSPVERLAFPLVDVIFPELDGERTLKPGDTFTEDVQMPMPSRLSIAGLDKMAVRLTRRYTLQRVQGQEAFFDVAVLYAADPNTPPTAERTTCVITGGGRGDAVFDLADGVFVSASQATKLVIDIDAPLRRLPDQPADADPGTGKSHMEIFLNLSGKQKVAQLFEAEPKDAGSPGAPPSPEPAPQGGGSR